MFDLEKAIADWRQQMLTAGIKTPVPLEELENHLREEIERQVKSGLTEQPALEISVRRIGQPEMLHREFKKSERTFMKRTLIILAGVFGVLVGMALLMPAAHLYKEQGMVHNAVVGFGWGIPIVLLGASTTFYGFNKRKA
ncbi:MAG TPA: permease prefix domain 1-containing protein [Candidatus Limnocylindrales bacterium]|nr:permease prefix domain 1-containing protein [Candidatus Limnocylindrales bacterium]